MLIDELLHRSGLFRQLAVAGLERSNMHILTSRVFQALVGNGYEVKLDRDPRSKGVRVSLINRDRLEEAFFYFDAKSENSVVESLAWEYCSREQIDRIYSATAYRSHTTGTQRSQPRSGTVSQTSGV